MSAPRSLLCIPRTQSTSQQHIMFSSYSAARHCAFRVGDNMLRTETGCKNEGKLCQWWAICQVTSGRNPNGILAKHCVGLNPRERLPMNWPVSPYSWFPPHTGKLISDVATLTKIYDIFILDFGGVQLTSVPGMWQSGIFLSADLRMPLFPISCEFVGRLKAFCSQVSGKALICHNSFCS